MVGGTPVLRERGHDLSKFLKPGLPIRYGSLVLAVPIMLIIQGLPTSNPAEANQPLVRLAVPIDADSPEVWSEVIAGAPSVGVIILNPSNGPGVSANATYTRLVEEAQARGISVLGYVYTQWANGQVSVQQAEGWIDRYYSWYHVDGIMLDEVNDTCDPAPLHFYSALYDYVKSEARPGTVMLNPGETTGECYATVSDVLLTFENEYPRYVVAYVGSNWTESTPPNHFFHIVFGVPNVADMQGVISTAVERGAGWVYVTNLNDSDGNPYRSLPSYFSQELSYVEQLDHPMHSDQASQGAMQMLLILGFTAAGSAMVVVRGRKKVAE